MSLEKTDGVMIFSMINFEKGDTWELLKEALAEPPPPVSKRKYFKSAQNRVHKNQKELIAEK